MAGLVSYVPWPKPREMNLISHLVNYSIPPPRPASPPRHQGETLHPKPPSFSSRPPHPCSHREKPVRRQRRGAVFYPARGGPCRAVPSLAAVRIGGGRRGLAWLLPAGCARGVLSQWRRRQVVVLAVAERQRPLPTHAFNIDEGPQRAGWPFGRWCSGSWRRGC
jgi:hypothetical protein